MRKRFKEIVTDIAGHDEKLVVLLGDISVYLFNDFKEQFPARFYNLGICENTLISVAAGLSAQGMHPIVHTIAPFITERSFEQIKLDLCYNLFGANIVSCGASFDYAWDGASHHSYADLAILRLLPGMEVVQPGSVRELEILFPALYNNGHPTYFRLSDHPHTLDLGDITFGKAVVLKDNHAKVTVMTAGPIAGNVVEACKDLSVNMVYFHTIKPIDTEVIQHFKKTKIIVVHDAFGLYEAIHEVPEISASFHGLPDAFCDCYGTLNDIRMKLKLDVKGIRETIVSNMR
ncbi:MAG: hypothetical protein KBA46_01730 [Candidatus Omnitrophica bacterium]|nr:hypothetical protein [Candidatus Omnitrophota bacterium]